MKNNNKGFSLLEMIISFAILAVVSVAILSFMGAGSSTYRSVSSETTIQYESQLALSQLQEYLIDCNGGVCFDANDDNSVLYVLNVDAPNAFTLHTFQLIGNEIYYDTQPVAIGPDDSLDYYTIDSGSYHPDLMASNITRFEVTVDIYYDSMKSLNIATDADLTLEMRMAGRNFTGSQNTSFRNAVIFGNSLDAMARLVIFGPD